MGFLGITKKSDQNIKKASLEGQMPALPMDQLGLSPEAAQHIKEMAEEKGFTEPLLRVGIMGGGCSGLSFHYAVETQAKPDDQVFEAHGVKVCVDPKSFKLVGGSWLTWHSDLGRSGFRVISPKLKKSCSCGESFTL